MYILEAKIQGNIVTIEEICDLRQVCMVIVLWDDVGGLNEVHRRKIKMNSIFVFQSQTTN